MTILLREIREKSKLSQAELSKLSGVPQQTISSIESGNRPNPTVETILALCRPLQCTITDMVKTDSNEQGESA